MGGPKRHDRDLILNEYSSFEDVQRKYKALLADKKFLRTIKPNKKITLNKSVCYSYNKWKDMSICLDVTPGARVITSPGTTWYRYTVDQYQDGGKCCLWHYLPSFKTIKEYQDIFKLNCTDDIIKKFI